MCNVYIFIHSGLSAVMHAHNVVLHCVCIIDLMLCYLQEMPI